MFIAYILTESPASLVTPLRRTNYINDKEIEMGWIKLLKNSLVVLILCVFLPQITGCGTILYPERKGQKGGQIDVGVAALDGIGLLVFLVPGVIAFAVDFATGTIYLPGGKASLYPEEIMALRVEGRGLDKEAINRIVAGETGISGALDSDRLRVYTLKTGDNVQAKLAQLKAAGLRAI